ncbi:MAG: MOSC domain-containing protein [Alphaproteobacteria bacterium]|nr:MOSC domain-containing protein [Alphaproteobacteria bacterium]
MNGRIASLWRHPVKGLTPEPLDEVSLSAGEYFPNDRMYAVEVGPSGFDPDNPQFVSKMRFAVLARFPELARVKTQMNDETGRLGIGDAAGFGVEIPVGDEAGREALARYLQAFLGAEADAPLNVLVGPGGHRFTDNKQDGFVSAINLASIRAIEQAIGEAVDPRRFRANVYYDAGEPWIEDGLVRGDAVAAGGAQLKAMKSITRCIATHANPETGERDIDMLDVLQRAFGRNTLGHYFSVREGGRVARGDTFARMS